MPQSSSSASSSPFLFLLWSVFCVLLLARHAHSSVSSSSISSSRSASSSLEEDTLLVATEFATLRVPVLAPLFSLVAQTKQSFDLAPRLWAEFLQKGDVAFDGQSAGCTLAGAACCLPGCPGNASGRLLAALARLGGAATHFAGNGLGRAGRVVARGPLPRFPGTAA